MTLIAAAASMAKDMDIEAPQAAATAAPPQAKVGAVAMAAQWAALTVVTRSAADAAATGALAPA